MKKTLLYILLLLAVAVLPAGAQQISVEDYKCLKRTWLKRFLGPAVQVDKQQAILDLTTNEKGFTFKAEGKIAVKAKEQKGMLQLLLPDRTHFLLIEHPDYGQTYWKVPDRKGLRKKKHYQALLHTSSPSKTFKPGGQWLVMEISPDNAIVHLDSTVTMVRNGRAQFFLPPGTHKYQVESPFHEAVEDSVVLTDSVRMVLPVVLQPFYSYLTVENPVADYEVYIDDQYVGQGNTTSGHLAPGTHQLTIRKGKVYYYDKKVTVAPAEKKVLTLTADSLHGPQMLAFREHPVMRSHKDSNALASAAGDSVAVVPASATTDGTRYAPVTIKAPNDSSEIWVDRERVGIGSWSGALTLGFHAVSIKAGGLDGKPTYLFLDSTFPKTIDMTAPQEDYGILNVSGNVVGARVLVNGQQMGVTPCLIENLPSRYIYTVTLQMDGYHDKTLKVKPRGNDMVDVVVTMKKK